MPKYILSLFAFFAMMPTLFAADFLRPTATIERGDSPVIRVSITWAKLNADDLTKFGMLADSPDTGRLALIRLLDICIVQGQEECGDAPKKANYREPEIDKTPITNLEEEIFAQIEEGVYFEADQLDNTQTLRAQIRLSTSGNAPKFTKDTKLSFKIVPETGTPETENGVDVTFAAGVSETLQDTGIARSKRLLTAYWRQLGSVGRSDGSSSPATGVLAVLFPGATWQSSIPEVPVYEYNPDFNAAIVSATCTLTVDPIADTCSLNCPAGKSYVLDATAIESLFGNEGVRTQSVAAGNSASFSQLENGEPYAILLQYLPDGINRACVVGTPSDAMILTEIASGREPKPGDASCFVATAAYGSPLHQHLDTLRWFRDTVLLANNWTRELVRFYYHVGPLAAQFIADKPTLRAAVRGALWGPVHYIESYRQQPTHTLWMTAGALLACAFAWLTLKPLYLLTSARAQSSKKIGRRR